MWRIYSIGFGLMAAVMIVAGAVLIAVTLANPPIGGSTPEWEWLLRAAVAIVMGIFAAGLSTLAWRQARRPSA
jgi:type IV secretory pathway VirB2 component (pilin)